MSKVKMGAMNRGSGKSSGKIRKGNAAGKVPMVKSHERDNTPDKLPSPKEHKAREKRLEGKKL